MANYSQNTKKGFSHLYARFLMAFHIPILLVSLVFAGWGAYYSGLLYMNLKTDLEELLPENAQSVKDVKKVLGKVGGFAHLSIVIESPNGEGGFRFQQDLANEMRKLPPTLVARVQDNIIKEREFFIKNKHLYMDLEDWKALDTYIEARIAYFYRQMGKVQKRAEQRRVLGKEKARAIQKQEALMVSQDKEPEFDFKGLEDKYRKRAAAFDHLPGGYFQSANGHTHVLLAFLPGRATDQKANENLLKATKEIIERLNPKRYDRQMVIGFNGDVSNMIEEHDGLIEDLELSSIAVLVLVAAALLFYYRSFPGVYALCAALFAGTFWTFGVGYKVVGYLNANTAFLGSIVIGNGINFGIIFMARYFEERKKQQEILDSLASSMSYTVTATLVAALAAGTSYTSLMITNFRGFNQFGIIGGIGMVFCWIATFTVLPSMIVFLEKRKWLKIKTNQGTNKVTGLLAQFVKKYNVQIVYSTLFTAVFCLLLCFKFGEGTIETDFSKLRNAKSLREGSGYWGRKVDGVFQRYLTPTVVVTDYPAQATRVSEILKEEKAVDGELSPISEIRVVEDFLPTEQEEKIKHINHIRKMLTPKIMSYMKPRDKKRAEDIIPFTEPDLRTVSLDDIPEGLKVLYRELDGTIGRLVHVYPLMQSSLNWDGREVMRFAAKIRSAMNEAKIPEGQAAIAGSAPLSAEMISIISTDGPKATLAAFLAVAFLVLIVFRNLKLSGLILGALLLGVLWMAGIMAYYDIKVNFLNFIALPITFGIGVDYAVNVIARYYYDKQNGKASIEGALKETGGAVALCSITTMIGYGSLLIAGSQAFVSFGILAVLGELTCIVAALISMPAFFVWNENRKTKSLSNSLPKDQGHGLTLRQ